MYRYHHEICSIITFFMFSLRGYLIHNKNIQLNIKLAHPQSKTFTALKSYRILLITCLKWPHQRTLSLTYNGGHALSKVSTDTWPNCMIFYQNFKHSQICHFTAENFSTSIKNPSSLLSERGRCFWLNKYSLYLHIKYQLLQTSYNNIHFFLHKWVWILRNLQMFNQIKKSLKNVFDRWRCIYPLNKLFETRACYMHLTLTPQYLMFMLSTYLTYTYFKHVIWIWCRVNLG